MKKERILRLGAICILIAWALSFLGVWWHHDFDPLWPYDREDLFLGTFHLRGCFHEVFPISLLIGIVLGVLITWIIIKMRIGRKNTEATPSQDSASNNRIEQLKELKKLLDEGVITQEEFEKQKDLILNS